MTPVVPIDEVILPVIADNSICCYQNDAKGENERQFNQGRSLLIKMKGVENLLVLAVDPAAIKNKLITKAVLRIRGTESNMMVRRVGFSTMATVWPEGNSAVDGPGQPGDSCFRTPELGSGKTWAGPGSDILDTVWGYGGTLWTQSGVSHDKDMWFDLEFDPRILEACGAGLSAGILVSDDNGQTVMNSKEADPEGNSGNNWFYSRHSPYPPYFIVTATDGPDMKPQNMEVSVKPWPGGAEFDSGGLEISWPGPQTDEEYRGILGYRIKMSFDGGEMKDLSRWMHLAPALAGTRARALLKFQPAGAKAKVLVEVVTRAGRISQSGTGEGAVSAKLSLPPKFVLKHHSLGAGSPLSNGRSLLWAVPDCVKVNPITGNVLEEAGTDYSGAPTGRYRQANPVWDGERQAVVLAGLRGEWVGFQLICENLEQGSTTYKIAAAEFKGPRGLTIPADAVGLSRLWYLKADSSEKGWYADPLLDLGAGEAFCVPDQKNAVPGQKNQAVYAEVFIPQDAVPGDYQGRFTVSLLGAEDIFVPVKLRIGSGIISKEAHFVWSMMTYDSPGIMSGPIFMDRTYFLPSESSYYRMCHLHRATLSPVYYGHDGTASEDSEPPLTGKGKNMRVKDWTRWDKRFGRYFDASAFKGTPREGVGLDHFILPLCEHYPTSMNEGYQWNKVKWEDHWKTAGPIEQGFSQIYKEQWEAIARDFIKHIKEKGWKTGFQVYPNDKYDSKLFDYRKKNGKEGVCFWRLDEPMHMDDFLAVKFFGELLRQSQQGEAKTILYRVDLSYPQWGRDTLDPVMDIDNNGGAAKYRRFMEDWRERNGQVIWNYGAPPEINRSAFVLVGQALDQYSRGCDGFVEWLVLGGPKDWQKPAATTVLYPGDEMGHKGACASLRLKAFRRGEQDVEYLWLLANKLGLSKDDPNRRRLYKLLENIVHPPKTQPYDETGSSYDELGLVKLEDLEGLRWTIADILEEK